MCVCVCACARVYVCVDLFVLRISLVDTLYDDIRTMSTVYYDQKRFWTFGKLN